MFYVLLIAAVLLGTRDAAWADGAGGEVITPLSSYSVPAWKEKAFLHRDNLAHLRAALAAKFPADQMRLLTASESSVAGIGFWPKPVGSEQASRYLGVFAVVHCLPGESGPPYPNTEEGRVLRIFDAYGKDTIKQMVIEMNGMNDPDIAGGVIIFIYCGQSSPDPLTNPTSEAFAIYMPKEAIVPFAQLRLRLQALFDQSFMLPLFHGPEEIKSLRLLILQP